MLQISEQQYVEQIVYCILYIYLTAFTGTHYGYTVLRYNGHFHTLK